MPQPLAFYDEQQVGVKFKCLADCFLMAAENKDKHTGTDNIIGDGLDLFKKLTGEDAPQNPNAEESKYLRWQFAKIASKLAIGERIGWMSPAGLVTKRLDKIEEAVAKSGITLSA